MFIADDSSDGQRSRQRKSHTKSRSGCKQCKARRIKCDEQPCHNYTRRKWECEFVVSPKTSSLVSRQERLVETPPDPPHGVPTPLSSPINLEHMRLLNHFQSSTALTFIMDPEIWKQAVITLALENTFLMHAVFLVTATHLQHLQPHETRYQLVALEHLSHTLPRFHMILAAESDFTGSHGEALIAYSMLLLQYAWTYDSEGWASLLGLYRGLTNVVLQYTESLDRSDCNRFTTMFNSMLAYSPRLHLESHFQDIPVPPAIDIIFTHILSCSKISETQPDDFTEFREPSKRLKTILFALSLGQRRLEDSGLMLDVARYLFSWPNLLPSSFIDLLKREDGRAQVILLYHFAAVKRLRADRFWWMRERGMHMFEAILSNLGDDCTVCTTPARSIYNGEPLDIDPSHGIGVEMETEAFVQTPLNFQYCSSQHLKISDSQDS